MNLSYFKPSYEVDEMRVGVIRIETNEIPAAAVESAFLGNLLDMGATTDDLLMIKMPSVLEIPLLLKKLLVCGEFDVIVVIGYLTNDDVAVTESFVAAVAQSMVQLSIEFDTPVMNGILLSMDADFDPDRCDSFGSNLAKQTVRVTNCIESIDGLWDSSTE